jgi:hypothetical protein
LVTFFHNISSFGIRLGESPIPVLSTQPAVASEVDWEGHPWMLPSFIVLTVEAAALAIILSAGEFAGNLAYRRIGPLSLIDITLGFVLFLWLVGTIRLAIQRASNKYTLRGSSLEIQRGLLGKRIFTVSAAGFSDLEVIKSITGRILNMGTIMIETDSDRDLRLIKVRDPVRIAALIRQVMTVPVVRVAAPGPPAAPVER